MPGMSVQIIEFIKEGGETVQNGTEDESLNYIRHILQFTEGVVIVYQVVNGKIFRGGVKSFIPWVTPQNYIFFF
jgi:hypothetical protein